MFQDKGGSIFELCCTMIVEELKQKDRRELVMDKPYSEVKRAFIHSYGVIRLLLTNVSAVMIGSTGHDSPLTTVAIPKSALLQYTISIDVWRV